ncbi:MAG: cobalamin-independent methionine synthase II family protein [Egibacteraceae bacterium]
MVVTARAEHVGSLLRPRGLLEARRAYARGEFDDAAFKRVEDEAVREVVALQTGLAFPVVTDGELRRESFQSDLCAAVDGFEGVTIDAWLWGDWHSGEVGNLRMDRPKGLGVVAPLRPRRTVAAEEFTFLRGLTDAQTKVTLPSPSMLSSLWDPQRSREAYPTLDGFLADVVAILSDTVRELRRLGCTYVQLDAPHYPLLMDPGWRAFYSSRGWTADRWLGYGLELDNALIDAAPDLTFGFHLCRGNQGSRWLVAGGYDAIAEPVFSTIRAQRLLLEYDDERSGGFGPLRHVRDDTVAVLGLVTTKTPRRETPQELGRPGATGGTAPALRAARRGDPVRVFDLGGRERDHGRRPAPQAGDPRPRRPGHLGLRAGQAGSCPDRKVRDRTKWPPGRRNR